MRISDWSSDVCSSDLSGRAAEDGAEKDAAIALHQALIHAPGNAALTHCVCCRCFDDETGTVGTNDLFPLDRYALVSTGSRADDPRTARDRSEERRVGKGSVSTGSFRWWADH